MFLILEVLEVLLLEPKTISTIQYLDNHALQNLHLFY